MKTKTVFFCSECGYESPKWMGKCPGCQAWNTMVEETVTAPARAERAQRGGGSFHTDPPKYLREIAASDADRLHTGMTELDRVLGGGIVPGSLVLIGGDPGIGKSTILLQICEHLGKTQKILYVSGEESQQQIKLRAERLGVTTDGLRLYCETNMEDILSCTLREKPDILIVDSVQTMYNPALQPAPGSVTQIRDVAAALMRIAKENTIATFLVGHVTKDGAIAGPKVLEHIVDCVLYFEGEQQRAYRIIRAMKNRFGSTNEIGVFEMDTDGISEVPNPSVALLSGRPDDASGSCIVCTMEGTRPVLAEIQALTSPTAFGNPRRMANGLDLGRVLMLLAVLEKRAGIRVSGADAYVNVVGGLRMAEPAIDLGILLAVASSVRNRPLDSGLVAVGEIGLTGELRSCTYMQNRILEAEKLGFTKCIIPAANAKKLETFKKIQVCPYFHIRQVLQDVL